MTYIPPTRTTVHFDLTPTTPSRTANFEFAEAVSNIGRVKVWMGSAWVYKPVKVWMGSSWVEKPVKYYNGSIFETTSGS